MVQETDTAAPDGVVTGEESARRRGVSPRRVLALVEDGALRARRFAGVWMVETDSIDRRLRRGAWVDATSVPRVPGGSCSWPMGSCSWPMGSPRHGSILSVAASSGPTSGIARWKRWPRDWVPGAPPRRTAPIPPTSPRITGERGLMLTGGSGAVEPDLGLVDPGRLDAYHR